MQRSSILITILVYVLASTTSYAVTRHCTATVKVDVYSAQNPKLIIKSKLKVFSFKAGGVATLPNKARKNAKKNAYQCITQHFNTFYISSDTGGTTGTPPNCTTENRIPEYDMSKSLYERITNAVCSALPPKEYQVQTWVYASGKKGCKGAKQLYHNATPYTGWRKIKCK